MTLTFKEIFTTIYESVANRPGTVTEFTEASNNSQLNTLGQVITELFPCLYFIAGEALDSDITTVPASFWRKIKNKLSVTDSDSPFLFMGENNKKTKTYSKLSGINDLLEKYAVESGPRNLANKLKQAALIYEKINADFPEAEAVQWGDQCQPPSYPVSEADIYVRMNESYVGISLKATKTKTGGFSLKNRSLATWFSSGLPEDKAKATEKIDAVEEAVEEAFREFPGLGLQDLNSKDRKEQIAKIVDNLSASSKKDLEKLYVRIKNKFNAAFAEQMNSLELEEQKSVLLKAMFDEENDSGKRTDTEKLDLRVWKATNTEVVDLGEQGSGGLAVLKNAIENAAEITFESDDAALTGITMECTAEDSSKISMKIEARYSHSTHYKDVNDKLVQNGFSSTFLSTLVQDPASWQIMPKPAI